jgi:hypothetical protein
MKGLILGPKVQYSNVMWLMYCVMDKFVVHSWPQICSESGQDKGIWLQHFDD